MVMYTGEMERTNIYLDDETRAAAQFIRERFALSSDSDAMRFAIRQLALQNGWQTGGPPPKPSRQRERAQRRPRIVPEKSE